MEQCSFMVLMIEASKSSVLMAMKIMVLPKCGDDSDDCANKHLTHLSLAVKCHLAERSKQKMRVIGDKNNGVDNSVDDSNDGGDKHLTHLSLVVDCHLAERSKQIKCVVGNKDDGVDNSGDDSDDSANKHLTHLSLAD
eukprot:4547681-Ditylum_brightwellii.AAC.1